MECWISIWASCTYLPSPSLFGALSTHAPLSDRSSEEKTVRAVSDTNQHGSAILASHLDHVYIYIHPRMCVHMVARLVCALQGAACVSSVTSDRGRADDVRGSFHRLRLVYPEPIRNHNIHPGRGAQGELGRRDGEMEGERTRMYVCMCIHSSLLALPFL